MTRKMGPKSAGDRMAAGLRWQAAVRLIPFGLVNRVKMAAQGFAHRMVLGVLRTSSIKPFLILLAAGLWCFPLPGATDTKTREFETPPLQPGSIQWEINQQTAREQQGLYRKRVPIPDAIGGNVPRSATASLVNGPRMVTAPTSAPTASSGIVLQLLFYAAAFTLTGILILQRFAPQILAGIYQQLNPWALAPAAERDPSARIRAEEEAFGEFLKEFRVGPAASARVGLPVKDDPISEFYARAKELLVTQRKLLQDIGRESSDSVRQQMLTDLRSEMGVLKGESGLSETLPVWQTASALEGLLKQLTEKIRNVTPSTLRTVAGGLDLLDDLCGPGLRPDLLTDRPLRFLVVDDDRISCQALSHSLGKVFSQPDLAADGEAALARASRQAYDVIFLDVQMPGMDGFELCTKIRETVPNRTTPVVFVTQQSDFDARCKSTLSGGNDLMGKPFLTFEVTVKALTLALHGRLGGDARKPLPKPDRARDTADSLVTVTEAPVPVPSPTLVAKQPLLPPVPKTDEILNAFLVRASKQLDPLWGLCRTILQISNQETRQTLLVDGFLRINSLISELGPEVVHPAYQMSAALEGLFRKMLQDSKYVTPSALDTVTTAVALLTDLCVPGLKPDLAINPPIHMLVVDDDLVARRALVGALQTAFTKPESAENGEAALVLAVGKPFDVIFLDVVMPGMDGFEVCAKIRGTVPNRATPVVFVTGQSDFDARAEMSRNGGDDLMGKPFLTSEITVKALTFALRGRLQQLKTPPCS
jgi:CheY-like chemotaxis protein